MTQLNLLLDQEMRAFLLSRLFEEKETSIQKLIRKILKKYQDELNTTVTN